MIRPLKTYLRLPIPASADRYAQGSSQGPQNWANLLIDAALNSRQAPDLLHKLRHGKVSLSVIFGPADWKAARKNRLVTIEGGLKAEGNSLELHRISPSEKPDLDEIIFSRSSIDAPYAPVTAQRGDQQTRQFPADLEADVPSYNADIANRLFTGTEVVRALMDSSNNASRLVPYVRISTSR